MLNNVLSINGEVQPHGTFVVVRSRTGRLLGWTNRGGLIAHWDTAGKFLPVEATVDEVGRIVLPKPLRERLRLTPGTKVDVSEYGDGLHITAVSRTARVEERDGRLVAVADAAITDDDVLALIDAGRR